MKILIAEDESLARSTLKSMLQELPQEDNGRMEGMY